MTRDGFTLLAMGFTGKTALAFKVRYLGSAFEIADRQYHPDSYLDINVMV